MGALDRSIDKILNVITHKEGAGALDTRKSQNFRSNAAIPGFQPPLGVISESNSSQRIPQYAPKANAHRASGDRYALADDELDLLPETKYEYPAHIAGVSTSHGGRPQPPRLPSKESALTKADETTPALQSYLRSLQQRQKEYINE